MCSYTPAHPRACEVVSQPQYVLEQVQKLAPGLQWLELDCAKQLTRGSWVFCLGFYLQCFGLSVASLVCQPFNCSFCTLLVARWSIASDSSDCAWHVPARTTATQSQVKNGRLLVAERSWNGQKQSQLESWFWDSVLLPHWNVIWLWAGRNLREWQVRVKFLQCWEDFLDRRAIASQDDWKAIRIDEKADKKLTVDQVSTSACKRQTSHPNVLSSWRHFCICPCNPDIQTERNCIGHVRQHIQMLSFHLRMHELGLAV